jgi:hypothetical protein
MANTRLEMNMPVNSTRELKQQLFDAYGGFADKRYHDIERDAPFIVDDRTERDRDSRGQLFLWFCQMFVTVRAKDRIHLLLRGGTPESDAVTQWIDAHGAEREAGGIGFDILPGTLADLEDLAQRFEAVIRRRYETKAYKHVVPRLAASLRRLRKILDAAWS